MKTQWQRARLVGTNRQHAHLRDHLRPSIRRLTQGALLRKMWRKNDRTLLGFPSSMVSATAGACRRLSFVRQTERAWRGDPCDWRRRRPIIFQAPRGYLSCVAPPRPSLLRRRLRAPCSIHRQYDYIAAPSGGNIDLRAGSLCGQCTNRGLPPGRRDLSVRHIPSR